MPLFLITSHSYGRQGTNNSGPNSIHSTLERAREHIKDIFIQNWFSDEGEELNFEDTKFSKPDDEYSDIKNFGYVLKPVESYAIMGELYHYAYDFEDELYTIWKCAYDSTGTQPTSHLMSPPKQIQTCPIFDKDESCQFKLTEVKEYILETSIKCNVPEPFHFYEENLKCFHFIWSNEKTLSLRIFHDDSSLVELSDGISHTYENTSENIENILHTVIILLKFINF